MIPFFFLLASSVLLNDFSLVREQGSVLFCETQIRFRRPRQGQVFKLSCSVSLFIPTDMTSLVPTYLITKVLH